MCALACSGRRLDSFSGGGAFWRSATLPIDSSLLLLPLEPFDGVPRSLAAVEQPLCALSSGRNATPQHRAAIAPVDDAVSLRAV